MEWLRSEFVIEGERTRGELIAERALPLTDVISMSQSNTAFQACVLQRGKEGESSEELSKRLTNGNPNPSPQHCV